jgi:transcriptional regulator with XRE-family HTH domain
MLSCANLIGPNVVKFRHQRDWTQEQLVTKLQLAGLYITRDILANIELRRSAVTDMQIQALADVFGIMIPDLFPPKKSGTQTMWRVDQLTDRSRRH